jgi:protein phosphatase 2C family protein 2/3
VLAEFRGPGVHHNFDDSDSGYDVDMDQKLKSFGGNQRGRIILLGDGTEVLTDSDDTEMFDHGEEDKDLASQVPKGQTVAEPEAATSSEKAESKEPKYQGVADKVLPKESAETKAENVKAESK